MKSRGILAVIVTALSTGAVYVRCPQARERQTQTQTAAPAATNPSAPTVPDEARRAFADLQIQRRGLVSVARMVQRELDATDADLARLVAQLQQREPEYVLTPDLTYVKRPPAKAQEKKDGSH